MTACEAIKGKKALFLLATEESESENRAEFRKLTAEYIENPLLKDADIRDWETLFRTIAAYQPELRKVIVIDEFQYIAKSYAPFISVMQKIWDTILSGANVMLCPCRNTCTSIPAVLRGSNARSEDELPLIRLCAKAPQSPF